MRDFILIMHNDAEPKNDVADATWASYFENLKKQGAFVAGVEIGEGLCMVKMKPAPPPMSDWGRYIRIQARSMRDAAQLVEGNPVFEAGGTVEVRALTRH